MSVAKVKMSPDEKAANLQRRATEVTQKADCALVSAILKRNPEAAGGVLKHLASLGYTIDTDDGHKAPSSSFKAGIENRDARKRLQAAAPHPSLPSEFAASHDPRDLIPTKYDTIGLFTITFLANKCLGAIEPGNLSPSNLRSLSLRTSGHSDSHKTILLRLLEFATGVPDDFPITGKLRLWSELQAMLCQNNEARGRRARDIALPPDWAEGLYLVQVKEDGIIVVDKYAGHTVSIPRTAFIEATDLSKLYIEFNWSETRATLFCQGLANFVPIKMLSLFACASLGASPVGQGLSVTDAVGVASAPARPLALTYDASMLGSPSKRHRGKRALELSPSSVSVRSASPCSSPPAVMPTPVSASLVAVEELRALATSIAQPAEAREEEQKPPGINIDETDEVPGTP